MKKKVLLLTGLLFGGFSALAQISTLPYTQSFDDEFTLGTDVEFLPNWTGNTVNANNRIFKETTDYSSAPAALAVIPTGSFDGEILIDLNLLNYTDASIDFNIKSMANGDGTRPTKIEMETSIDGGVTWSGSVVIGEFPNEDQATFTEATYNLPETADNIANVAVKIYASQGSTGSGTRAKVVIDDVSITGTESNLTEPSLTLTPGTLDFTQILGAPTSAQSVGIIGANLTENITLTASEPFEIALTEDGEFATTQSLTLVDGEFSGSVFVRLNATEANTFNGTLTAETAGVSPNTEISLNGEAANSAVTNPEPFDLTTSDYTFTEWSADASAGTYPNNMVFWINDAGDGVESTATDSYYNDWLCGYNIESASRILGENDNGVSFLNTGNTVTNTNCYGEGDGRLPGKPGAAVLALNTLERENVQIEWTGRTMIRNNRTYALRLQYRIGDGNGNPNINWQDFENIVEYVANDIEDHSESFTISLPDDASNQPIVQLRWIYFQHETNTASGSRAKLALDDITVSSEPLSTSNFELDSFSMYPNPATDIINFNEETTGEIYDLNGKRVLSFGNTATVNVAQLTKGIYIVRTDKGATSKLIIK